MRGMEMPRRNQTMLLSAGAALRAASAIELTCFAALTAWLACDSAVLAPDGNAFATASCARPEACDVASDATPPGCVAVCAICAAWLAALAMLPSCDAPLVAADARPAALATPLATPLAAAPLAPVAPPAAGRNEAI